VSPLKIFAIGGNTAPLVAIQICGIVAEQVAEIRQKVSPRPKVIEQNNGERSLFHHTRVHSPVQSGT